MIVTVTLNAGLDRTLTVPNFQRGQRHRASQGLSLAGGKGINVARALKRLDVPVVATGLANQDFRPAPFLGLPADLVGFEWTNAAPRKPIGELWRCSIESRTRQLKDSTTFDACLRDLTRRWLQSKSKI